MTEILETEEEFETEEQTEEEEGQEDKPKSIREVVEAAAEDLKSSQISDEATEPEIKADAPREESTEQKAPLNPPRFWSDEKKKEFSTLPRAWQEFLVERESQTERYSGTLSQEKAKYEKAVREINQSIPEETRAMLKQRGVDEQTYIKGLVKVDQFAQRDPEGAALWILQQNGRSLEDLQARMQAEMAMPESVRKVYAEKTQLEEEHRRANEELEEIRVNSFVGQIEAFAEEKDLKGEKLRPFMEDAQVQHEVKKLIPLLWEQVPTATPQQVLEEAYRRATSYLPHIREVESKKLDEQRKLEEKKIIEKARRASSSISSSAGVSASMYAKPTSIKDSIKLSLQQMREGRA